MTTTQQLVVIALAILMIIASVRVSPMNVRPRRRRLGSDTSARLARPGELAPLVVRARNRTGRFILGYVKRRLIATEAGTARRRFGRTWRGRGARSSVAIIGPTRCGKTAAAIGGILDWDGPAVLSSVKTDLMAATIGWRRRLGEVRVFDPTGSTGHASAGWSPLRGAVRVSGAQQAARTLIDAGPRTGGENVDFFLRLAEQLLWPHLYVAAASGHTMRDVVRWIQTQASPQDTTSDLAVCAAALPGSSGEDARQALHATWSLDHRTRTSAYATAQTLLGAWTDPGVAGSGDFDELDLAWLLEGSNTLYICAPLHHQLRLAPVFGGLLGDLVHQAYDHVNRTNAPLTPTLIVLDEAANTPTRWLPQVASTCAGIGLLLVTIWQSKAQLDAAYGVLADSVLTNHATKLFFAGISDLPTLEYVSRLVGDEEITRMSATTDWQHAKPSLTYSTQPGTLLPAHVLRQSRPGRALLVHGTLPPAELRTRPYFRDRRLRSRAAL
ncbi:MAG: type IV secretory system conjugative DNA transfer family protein [Acidimicrobiia bacterium]